MTQVSLLVSASPIVKDCPSFLRIQRVLAFCVMVNLSPPNLLSSVAIFASSDATSDELMPPPVPVCVVYVAFNCSVIFLSSVAEGECCVVYLECPCVGVS